jgi:hypothetical protein
MAYSALAVLAAGCGQDPGQSALPQCAGTGYHAFDPANHASQDRRVEAFQNIHVLLDQAQADPATAADRFTAAETLYQDSASLKAKVQGRKDDHLASKPETGKTLDQQIAAAFADGRAATTAFGVALARTAVEVPLLQFFYLSVYKELIGGAAKNWDEAFGYFGSGTDAKSPKAIAMLMVDHDKQYGTKLYDEVVDGLVRGSCLLGQELEAKGVTEIYVETNPELWPLIQGVDRRLQVVLAAAASSAASRIAAVQSAAGGKAATVEQEQAAWLGLSELSHFLDPIERVMLEQGGESKARAEAMRQVLAAANYSTSAWLADFNVKIIVDGIEAEFGVTSK